MTTNGPSAALARLAARVRPSAAADLADITAIYGHHVRHGRASLETEPPTLDEMAARRAALLAAGLPFLVLELDGATLGFAHAAPYRARPGYQFTVESSIYLDPEATGHGFGRPLLAALIAACEAQGLYRMVAVIGDGANLPSISLHRSLGFEMAGVLRGVGFKHGMWLDQVLMQRMLLPALREAA